MFMLVFLTNCNNKRLPVYGLKEYAEGIDQDTIYHIIPNWSFINQNGDSISSNNFNGNICVVDFFFTHCPTICPVMTNNMVYLQEKTEDLNVQYLSYSVNPKKDNPDRLKWYANKFGINEDNWNLLTGEQEKIYELGVKGYLVPNQEDALSPGGFLHSEKFILIDKKGRIRGFYNGTDINQMDLIIKDIEILIKDE